MSATKPVDLAAIRARIERGGNGTKAEIRAMANEIDALRRAASEVIKTIEQRGLEANFMISLPDLRALLPPTKLDDAREKFKESLRPIERAPKPTVSEVEEWGREFEASAVVLRRLKP